MRALAFDLIGLWVFLAGSLLLHHPGSGQDQTQNQPQNIIRIDSSVGVLATSPDPFLIPIFIRTAGPVDAVHIGLDYDEVLLRFDSWWDLDGAIGADVAVEKSDDQTGYLELTIQLRACELDPSSENTLIGLAFRLVDPISKSNYGYRSSAQINVDDRNTYFVLPGDQGAVEPDLSLDGSITIYSCNALEIGSAYISSDPQTFRIPVYATHLKDEAVTFSMGLDYDEVFLDLVDVKPATPLLTTLQQLFTAKTRPGEIARIEWPFVTGIYPKMFRQHIIDLVFQYRSDVGKPSGGMIKIIPILNPPPPEEGGSVETEIREGALFITGPKFLRGDADISGDLGIEDAFAILGYLLDSNADGAAKPSCLDAMDCDGNVEIDIVDVVVLLNYLFNGGSPPPAPFPEPGTNPFGAEGLGCDVGAPAFEPLPLEPVL